MNFRPCNCYLLLPLVTIYLFFGHVFLPSDRFITWRPKKELLETFSIRLRNDGELLEDGELRNGGFERNLWTEIFNIPFGSIWIHSCSASNGVDGQVEHQPFKPTICPKQMVMWWICHDYKMVTSKVNQKHDHSLKIRVWEKGFIEFNLVNLQKHIFFKKTS